ncbi:MAG: hypothetical protein QGM45_10255 [Anaerolineales bacterium]|nr:hypothetical protein [Anaerolineales bacterium]
MASMNESQRPHPSIVVGRPDIQDRRNHRYRAGSPSGGLAQTRENQKVIQVSMKRWLEHNKYGRSMGRGLSEAELIDKVAGETGASKDHIRRALKRED